MRIRSVLIAGIIAALTLSGLSVATVAYAAPPPTPVPSLLKGNVKPIIPAGKTGAYSVVERSGIDKAGNMGVVIRNNTTTSLGLAVKVTVFVGTKKVATSTPGLETTQPVVIAHGSWGLFLVHFAHPKAIPASGASFHYSFPSVPAFMASLKVTSVAAAGDQLRGQATNTTAHKLVGPYETNAFCFSLTTGKIHNVVPGFATTSQVLKTGQHVSFKNTTPTGASCPLFLVGANGFRN